MIKHRQPAGVKRHKLDYTPTKGTMNYEIRRVADSKITVLGYTRRAKDGWLVRKADSENFILSRGEHPHNRAMFWLAGDPGLTAQDGVLIGIPDGWELVSSSEVEESEVEESAANAATEALQTQGGQGFKVNPEARVAIDAYAMSTACEYYRNMSGEKPEDVHTENRGFDLISRFGSETRHVEVKGTITDGDEIILTPNEVRHALQCNQAVLFVLSKIRVETNQDGSSLVTGGLVRVCDPWQLSTDLLRPISYRYQLHSP